MNTIEHLFGGILVLFLRLDARTWQLENKKQNVFLDSMERVFYTFVFIWLQWASIFLQFLENT